MRAFIALELDDALRVRLGEELARLRRVAPNARWVRSESLHVTLAFLGEMADADVPALGGALAKVASRHGPFTLCARGPGTFGPFDRPKVLWTGLGGDVAALGALQADVAGELAALGYRPDFEKFEPHVTLARAKHPRGDPSLARCVAALGDAGFPEQAVDEVVLFSSETDRDGMRYRAMGRWRLGAAPATDNIK